LKKGKLYSLIIKLFPKAELFIEELKTIKSTVNNLFTQF